MEPEVVHVRVFAQVADSDSAAEISSELSEGLLLFGFVIDEVPTHYWKIPEYFELGFRILPTSTALECFDRLVATFQPGTVVRRPDVFAVNAIWTSEDSVPLLHPAVNWAEFDVVFGDGASMELS